jgi:hypothetical protein
LSAYKAFKHVIAAQPFCSCVALRRSGFVLQRMTRTCRANQSIYPCLYLAGSVHSRGLPCLGTWLLLCTSSASNVCMATLVEPQMRAGVEATPSRLAERASPTVPGSWPAPPPRTSPPSPTSRMRSASSCAALTWVSRPYGQLCLRAEGRGLGALTSTSRASRDGSARS